jgi:hypothetical protein
VRYEEATSIIQTVESAGVLVHSEHQVITNEWRIFKTGENYAFVAKLESTRMQVNGQFKDSSPIDKLMMRHPQTNLVSQGGHYLRLLQDDTLLPEVRSYFPTNFHAVLNSQLAPEFRDRAPKAEWEFLFYPLIGQTVKKGQVFWRGQVPDGARSGTNFVQLYAIRKASNIAKAGTNAYVTILTFCCSSGELLERFHLDAASDLSSPEVKDFMEWRSPSDALTKRCIRQVIDANTLLVSSQREIFQTVSYSNRGVNQFTQTTNKKFDEPEPF